jgi:hypothetical protein
LAELAREEIEEIAPAHEAGRREQHALPRNQLEVRITRSRSPSQRAKAGGYSVLEQFPGAPRADYPTWSPAHCASAGLVEIAITDAGGCWCGCIGLFVGFRNRSNSVRSGIGPIFQFSKLSGGTLQSAMTAHAA